MNLEIPELEKISAKLDALIENKPTARWLTLEQAYQLKFGRLEKHMLKHSNVSWECDGPSFATIKRTSAYQPAGGIPDAWHVNKKLWKRETVEKWLSVTDENLAEYLEETAPGTKLPAGIRTRLTSCVDFDVIRQAAGCT